MEEGWHLIAIPKQGMHAHLLFKGTTPWKASVLCSRIVQELLSEIHILAIPIAAHVQRR